MVSPELQEHDAAVARIAHSVRNFYENKIPFRIYHGHTNSTRAASRSTNSVVDTSKLNHVLGINLAAKTIQVEPNVAMDQLVDATLESGLIPLVVPEFRGITVGGAFAGTAGESSSYKHGIFDSTVKSIEIVLADGTITHTSAVGNSDLLHGSGGACGTLGVVTLLEVQLMDARDYVQVSYYPTGSTTDATALIHELDSDSKIDFIDGILYSPNHGVIIAGKLTDDHRNGTLQRFTRPWDQHYYRHVEKRLISSQPWTEVIPIRDYLFRYDRGCFWGAERAFKYFHVSFNRITRWVLDPFMSSKVMFHAMHESGLADQAIIQDLAVPIDKLADFVQWQDEVLKCYPLWLCPLRAVGETSTGSGRSFGVGRKAGVRDLFCNVGIWMMAPTRTHEQFVKLNRDIETEIIRLHGLKTLYAHSYYSEDEFWDIYDRESYQALRMKYNAHSLLDVYEKVAVKAKKKSVGQTDKATVTTRVIRMLKDALKDYWPFRGLYGVWKVLTSREYLLKQEDG